MEAKITVKSTTKTVVAAETTVALLQIDLVVKQPDATADQVHATNATRWQTPTNNPPKLLPKKPICFSPFQPPLPNQSKLYLPWWTVARPHHYVILIEWINIFKIKRRQEPSGQRNGESLVHFAKQQLTIYRVTTFWTTIQCWSILPLDWKETNIYRIGNLIHPSFTSYKC